MNNTYLITMALVMAGVTYCIRMLPFVCMRRKITSPYLLSLLYYLPYAVLAAMTFPAIFYIAVPNGTAPTFSTLFPALVGTAVALVTAWRARPLPVVAGAACTAVWAAELFLTLWA